MLSMGNKYKDFFVKVSEDLVRGGGHQCPVGGGGGRLLVVPYQLIIFIIYLLLTIIFDVIIYLFD